MTTPERRAITLSSENLGDDIPTWSDRRDHFHGDRGSQYLSSDYRKLIGDLDMIQSVGRTGLCWDNAVAESFWSSLKREVVHRYRFPDRPSARRAIFAWINRYNHHRLHSSLGYVPPAEWEQLYRQHQADQAA